MNFIEKVRQLPNAAKGYLFCDPERNGEFKFLKSVLAKSGKSPLILDVGSNIGQYAQQTRKYSPDAIIHCFEPTPETYQQLVLRFSADRNIEVNNIALSSKTGEADFYMYGALNERNSLENHSANDPELRKELVAVSTVDAYCLEKHIHRVHLMKIDVEGHEVNVLRGAVRMLNERRVEVVQFEYNILWKNTPHKLEQVFELLPDYRIYRLTPWGKIRIKKFSRGLENYPLASNYIAILK